MRVIITAAAWVQGEPRVATLPGGEPDGGFDWTVCAEASATDSEGEPMTKLSESVWHAHVTDASGHLEWVNIVDFGELSIDLTGPVSGFYFLRFSECFTAEFIAPTACGIAVHVPGWKGLAEVSGRVVVPIELSSPTAVKLLTTAGFSTPPS
jgi:hypothetical protein